MEHKIINKHFKVTINKKYTLLKFLFLVPKYQAEILKDKLNFRQQ